MPRIIAQNRIPRTVIGNRPITSRGPGIAAPLVVDRVGSVGFFPAGQQPSNYQDALTYPTPLVIGQYRDLFAMQGVMSGKTFTQSGTLQGTPGLRQRGVTVPFLGALYASYNGGGVTGVGKRSTLFGAVTQVQGSVGGQGCFVSGSRLLCVGYSNPNSFLSLLTNDSTVSTNVNLGTAINAQAFLEVVPGTTYIVLDQNAGPIWRTTNNGGAWASVAGNLSNPAARVWDGAWMNLNGNVHMIGQAMAIATSTDQGATWTVNTSVPNAATLQVNAPLGGGLCYSPPVVIDYSLRRGYGLTTTGALLSWSLDNPTSGFTTELASGMPTAQTRLGLMTYGLWFYTSGTSGWKVAPRTASGGFSAPVTVVTSLPNLPNPINALDIFCSFGLEVEGVMGMDFSLDASGVTASTPQYGYIADLANTSDRYILSADPNLPSGRKPYIRVI